MFIVEFGIGIIALILRRMANYGSLILVATNYGRFVAHKIQVVLISLARTIILFVSLA
jgi:hypothetical protein